MAQFLATFWNSPEQLSTALRWITVCVIGTTALFGATAYFVNDRIGIPQTAEMDMQAKLIVAQKRTVDGQALKTEQQSNNLLTLNDSLNNFESQTEKLTQGSSTPSAAFPNLMTLSALIGRIRAWAVQ